ncbi:hypothetical protein KKD19_04320 [Patescibacteria group bacterium]|nr:hypothetical protein [Patescibacteria group bacterium]MBU4512433.1 hypothetical protein [Patescibacteria group bacterium]MCG2692726.1 hypothetical protein [Candidatus Parcubacteria bacterium]
MNDTKIAIFRKKEIRKTIYKNEWWFSVLDIIGVLTDSPQPKTYWAKMKERDKEMSQPFPFWEQLKMRANINTAFHPTSVGEAWYVYPDNQKKHYLGRPADAFSIMRGLGLGITNNDLNKIPKSDENFTGDYNLRKRLAGKILLQVQEHGEAWYIYPKDLKRYYMGRPSDAFELMRRLGLGITNSDLRKIDVGEVE